MNANEPPLLCFDIGTSSIKAGIVSRTGSLEAWEHEDLLSLPGADVNRWDPNLWETAIKRCTGRLAQHRDAYSRAAGAVMSGHGPTVVCVDGRGDPIGDALMWIDGRAAHRPGTRSFFLPKIGWLKAHRPDIYERTAAFSSFPEFLYARITGERVTIAPSSEFEPYYWSDEELALFDIDGARFAPFVRVGAKVGTVTGTGARRTGIPAGMPVFAGGSDFLVSLLGTAAVSPGRTCDRAGTSEGINHCLAHPTANPRVRCLPHVVEGLYNAAGILASTGRIFEWFRSISGLREKSYTQMMEDVLGVGHDASIPSFLPSVRSGETWEFAGAVFSDLYPEHGAAEMGRAVVLSIGFSVRDVVETLEESGCVVGMIRACGGQARNDLWNQMKADITGKEIAVPEVVDAELMGDACAGFAGLGEFSAPVEAAEALVRLTRKYEPRAEEHRRFTDAYRTYRDARRRVIEARRLF